MFRSFGRAATCLFLCFFAFSLAASAANFTINVGGGSNSFSPNNLTIQVGDSVTWINQGGFHNVDAPGNFRCANGCDGEGGNGSPSGANWQFTRTFNSAATINYHCDPHQGVGMTGVLIVQGGEPEPEPGQLSFTAANTNAVEGAGSVNIGVQRTNGTDGAVSVQYSTSNGSAVNFADFEGTSGNLNWADGEGGVKSFSVTIIDDALDEPNETINLGISSATGGATTGSPSAATITILDNDEPAPSNGQLSFDSNSYSITEQDGTATITVERTGGSDGAVSVDYDATAASATDGLDFNETSGTLDWDDGDSASKSFDVTIFDDLEEEPSEMVNLALSSPTGGATLGTSSADLTITDNDGPPPCETDEIICLGVNDRFEARIEFKDFANVPGVGKEFDIGLRDSGLFYFFQENNSEVLVKVLDGCDITDHFWVFFAATTNVEFTLTVTDTQANVTNEYFNPLGQPADAVTDTFAFATCP